MRASLRSARRRKLGPTASSESAVSKGTAAGSPKWQAAAALPHTCWNKGLPDDPRTGATDVEEAGGLQRHAASGL
jgi:hypothetical protein